MREYWENHVFVLLLLFSPWLVCLAFALLGDMT